MKRLLAFLALLLLAPGSYAQSNDSLVVLFATNPGVRPAFLNPSDLRPGPERFDGNGDGKMDLLLVQDDENGSPRAIRVIDGATRSVLYQIPDLSALVDGESITGIYGFASIYLDASVPYLLVTGTDAIFAFDASTPKLVFKVEIEGISNLRLAGVTDLTGEGSDELILFSPQNRQVFIVGDPDLRAGD